MRKTVFVFSALIIALLTLFQLSKFSIVSGNFDIEEVIAFVAIVSFIVGVYFNKKSRKTSDTASNKIDEHKIKALEITTREYEVLKLIAQGNSNKEIAEKLFLSESTIKTHVSNLLLKLNAKRRTQAVQIAKTMSIL